MTGGRFLRLETQEPSPCLLLIISLCKKITMKALIFYYLGEANSDKNTVHQDKMEDGKSVIHMNMVMKQSIDSRVYHYIVSGMED